MLVPVFVRERLFIPRAPEFELVLGELRTKFNYHNPEYSKMKAIGKWTGSIEKEIKTWTNVDTQEWGPCLSLPRGGTNRVRSIFDKYDLKPYFVDHRLSLPPILHMTNDVVLRPDQQRLIEAMLRKENCLVRSPTGSGKTEVCLKFAEWILRIAGSVLIIVWETELLRQWIHRIQQRFGLRREDIGVIQGSTRRIAPITVAMQQTLLHQGFRYTHVFGGIIADEVQRFAAPTFQNVIDLFPARYRIGVSASETRRDRKEFLIYDAFGEVEDEIEKATLVEQGKIHEVVVRIVPTEFDYEAKIKNQDNEWEWTKWNNIPPDLKDFHDYLKHLIVDENRNDLIWNFMEPCLKQGHTCMLLTTRRDHVFYWDNRIRAAGYRSGLMLGGNPHEFEHTLEGLRNRTINVGVATITKGGTGHDIPQINRGFVVSPLAGNKQLFNQVLGRFTRPCEGKTDAVVYYFWDQLCYPGQKRMLSNQYPETYVWVKDQFLPA